MEEIKNLQIVKDILCNNSGGVCYFEQASDYSHRKNEVNEFILLYENNIDHNGIIKGVYNFLKGN